MYNSPPETLKELLIRAESLTGKTFGQLAQQLNIPVPSQPSRAKGWVGGLLEHYLGAHAPNKATPDFPYLGIELKSIPINSKGLPSETTYVTTVSLDQLAQQSWHESPVYQKLKQVLWVPFEGDTTIALPSRRIGQPILWQPIPEQAMILQQDWQEIVDLILMGNLSKLTSRLGTYLHVRPKAAHGKILQKTNSSEQTLPRGFYLRTALTSRILKN